LVLCHRFIVIQPGLVHLHQLRQEIIWVAPSRKNSKSCSDDWHCWRISSAIKHFGTHCAKSFRMYKSSQMMQPISSLEMPSYSTIDLAEIQRSSKISSSIWSIISRVVTVVCHPGRGASRVEKSPRLNWAFQFLTVIYDGAFSPNFSEWREFPSAPYVVRKNDDSWRPVVEIARVARHASF
jgi:hypothetical protein